MLWLSVQPGTSHFTLWSPLETNWRLLSWTMKETLRVWVSVSDGSEGETRECKTGGESSSAFHCPTTNLCLIWRKQRDFERWSCIWSRSYSDSWLVLLLLEYETHNQFFWPHGFFVFFLGDMDLWLLPLKPPEDHDCHRKIVSDSYYKDAVEYMRLTMQSPRYVSLTCITSSCTCKKKLIKLTISVYMIHNLIMLASMSHTD